MPNCKAAFFSSILYNTENPRQAQWKIPGERDVMNVIRILVSD